MSLRDVAITPDFKNYFNDTAYEGWDGDMIFGCVCDDGYEGVACNLKSCPKGDDPQTVGQVDTVQIIDCKCEECEGTVQLQYGIRTSLPIPYDASEDLIQIRLKVFINYMCLNLCF